MFTKMKPGKIAVAVFLWGCLQAESAWACRYNVRDVGFADLGTEWYYFYGYVDSNTPAEVVGEFKEISTAALMDSNIRAEIIDVDQQKDHLAMKYVDLEQIRSFPAAVLVSPEGQWLNVAVVKPGEPFKQTLWSALDEISFRGKRNEILQQISEVYGVVLLIEGTDAKENKIARQAASAAIEIISTEMGMMPKAIGKPPVLLAISPDLFDQERILLWSLGLNAEKIHRPCAAVLYGRMRRMGPVMTDNEITEDYLSRILAVVGADCECGLDRKWMLGAMLPVRWDQKMQTQTAKALGFDPENPMVKMEISQILGRSMGENVYLQELNSVPDISSGYQEIVITFDPSSGTIEQSPIQPALAEGVTTTEPDVTEVVSQTAEPPAIEAVSTTAEPPVTEPASQTTKPPSVRAVSKAAEPNDSAKITAEPLVTEEEYSSLRNATYIFAGLCVFVFVAAIFILLRAKRRY